jgi:uncharacterized protein YyaL (SSP411 family)
MRFFESFGASKLRSFAAFAFVACNASAPPARVPPRMSFDGPREELAWSDFSPATFARAKAERKFVVLDGSAEWCHWCHVMEAITYHDPDVRKTLDAHFIAAKVDVDARPDVEERYQDYGWPATVIFSPDGEELGKYKGYLAPDVFSEILNGVVQGKKDSARAEDDPAIPDAPFSPEHVQWIGRMVTVELDDWYDDDLGGWGKIQKAPLAANVAWELGHDTKRAEQTLEAELAMIDPVWGGMYQYSTDGDWAHPHYEKLMTVTAGALENYADAYTRTKNARWLEAVKLLRKYIDEHMTSKEGGFYATQDADLNAHVRGKPYLSGHDYYAKSDAERRALGFPRIDTHEYPRENGMVVQAYAKLDASAIESAKRAATRILSTHASPKSKLLAHDSERLEDVRHLADNAHFALGLLRLHEATKDQKWLDQARAIGDAAIAELADEKGGGFFAHSADPSAVGVFAKRRKPFEDNWTMVRVLARLARAVPEAKDKYVRQIQRTIRGMATPERIKDRGRFLGEMLLALDESKDLR